jgi:hypothetical protein
MTFHLAALPGLGASPDALIRHHLPIPWGAVEAARANIAAQLGVPFSFDQSTSAPVGISGASSCSAATAAAVPSVVLPGTASPAPEYDEMSFKAAAVVEAVRMLQEALKYLLTVPPGGGW